jgi:DNA-directed RNA polymerase subunit omega
MAIETPENSFLNKYSLVKGAARRARQLQSGAPPLLVSKSMKACRVAQDEIRQGRVTYIVQKVAPKPPIEPGI